MGAARLAPRVAGGRGLIVDLSEGQWRGDGFPEKDQPAGQGRVLATLHLTDSPIVQAGKTASVRTEVSLIEDRGFC